MGHAILFFYVFYLIFLIGLALDFIDIGPISIYYAIKWRYIKWKTNEKEHTWGNWIMINGGMEQIRFCKNCGKMDNR